MTSNDDKGTVGRPTGSRAIEVIGLSKTYDGGVTAVDGLDLSVESNTIYALLGPNGAGKTTAISVLTTLLSPTTGTASIDGHDVNEEERAVREQIGVTFQEMVLDDALTGRQVLTYHGRLYGLTARECRERSDELLSLVELSDAADRKCKTYSGGMKRRLELARALMTVPSVLFLDEPTLGLDPVGREKIWTYVRRLVEEEGLTVLLTTHYLDEAEQLADRVGIMDHGQLVAEGTPTELIESLGEDTVTLRGEGSVEELTRVLNALDLVQQVTKVDDGVLVSVSSSSRGVAQIVAAASEADFKLQDVSVAKPDLGSVFFKYTGHQMSGGGEE
jgi:ABC-2 type transport system ATP-binding protein